MKKSKYIDDWKYSNQNWIKVLNEIWKYAPNGYGRGKMGYDDNHPLAKRLKIKGYDLNLIMSFLEEQKLIEYAPSEHNWINLTSKGFDVARMNQEANTNLRVNRGVLFLTAVIAITGVINIFTGISDLPTKWGVSILFCAAVIGMGFTIMRNYK